jgi:hypothetical protein
MITVRDIMACETVRLPLENVILMFSNGNIAYKLVT